MPWPGGWTRSTRLLNIIDILYVLMSLSTLRDIMGRTVCPEERRQSGKADDNGNRRNDVLTLWWQCSRLASRHGRRTRTESCWISTRHTSFPIHSIRWRAGCPSDSAQCVRGYSESARPPVCRPAGRARSLRALTMSVAALWNDAQSLANWLLYWFSGRPGRCVPIGMQSNSDSRYSRSWIYRGDVGFKQTAVDRCCCRVILVTVLQAFID